jgi:ABC-2 type transport system permease protein
VTAMRKLFLTELKLFLRDPSTALVALGLPLTLLVVNGVAAGGQAPQAGVAQHMNMVTPMTVAAVLAIMGFSMYPPLLAATRELGLLRRMAATPAPAALLLGAQLLVQLLAAAGGMLLLYAVATLGFHASPPAAPAAFAAAWAVSALAVFALGMVIATLARTSRAASAVGMGVGFPMLFLAGAFVPREALSETVRRVGDATPLSPAVQVLRATWAGDGLDLTAVAVLAALAVAGIGVAARWFRWH